MPKAQTQAEIFENAGLSPFVEDTHAELLGELVSNPNYDIIQLDPIHDPDLVGLVVDGALRVSYRKEAEYTHNSGVARTILSRVRRQAVAAHTLVRGYGRAVRNSPAPEPKASDRELHGRMEQESTEDSFKIPEFLRDGVPDIGDTQPLNLPEIYPQEVGPLVEGEEQIGTQIFEPLPGEGLRAGIRSEDLPDWDKEEGWDFDGEEPADHS